MFVFSGTLPYNFQQKIQHIQASASLIMFLISPNYILKLIVLLWLNTNYNYISFNLSSASCKIKNSFRVCLGYLIYTALDITFLELVLDQCQK